jgi:phage-related protein
MIKVYESNERTFNHNGLKILHPTKAEIFIEDNGDYYIDIESSIDDINYLQEGMIIRANTRWGEQGFRLTNPKKKNKKISVRGYHLCKDSSRYIIVNSYVENKNCNDALDHFNNSCDSVTPFKTISDITEINSARIIRKTLEETLSIIIDKWGGHLYRDRRLFLFQRVCSGTRVHSGSCRVLQGCLSIGSAHPH